MPSAGLLPYQFCQGVPQRLHLADCLEAPRFGRQTLLGRPPCPRLGGRRYGHKALADESQIGSIGCPEMLLQVLAVLLYRGLPGWHVLDVQLERQVYCRDNPDDLLTGMQEVVIEE